MRYDKAVYFRVIEPGKYNADTANYGPDTPIETMQMASVTDSGIQTMKLVYGQVKQGSLTIRLLRPYTHAFKNIRVGEKIYSVDFSRKNKSFVVSEVKDNGQN